MKKLPTGTYQLISAQVNDPSDNDCYKTVNDFGEYIFSVDNPNYGQEEGGKTVVVNVNEINLMAPKALFEIIQGKDITVIFEKMYDYESGSGASDDGLQWIMKGKDIVPGKEKKLNDEGINVYFYIEEAWDDSFIKARQKHHKNPYPEMATSGEPGTDPNEEAKTILKNAG